MNIHLATRHLVLLAAFSLFSRLSAQMRVGWDRVFGAEQWEQLNGLIPLNDGYLLGGCTRSGSLTVFPNDTAYDYLLVRTDLQGNQIWSKTYGGRQYDWLWDAEITTDGHFILIGGSNSDASVSKTHNSRGGRDFWVMKVDADGNQVWDYTYGGSGYDEAFDVQLLSNGNILVLGASDSDISGEKQDTCRGDHDMWLLVLNPDGQILWQKTVGGNGIERAYEMTLSRDEQFLYVVGGTHSTPGSGDIGDDPRLGSVDMWVAKIHLPTRSLTWSHRYGGGGPGKESLAYRVLRTFDDQLIVGGLSEAPPQAGTSAPNRKTSEHYGKEDYWLIKINQAGQKLPGFDLSIGGSGLDVLYGLYENFFGDIIISGVTDSPTGSGIKDQPKYGHYDIWTICLDRHWNILWQQVYGGDDWDSMTRIKGKPDGTFVIGGHSKSTRSGTKTIPSLGENDFLLIKSDCSFQEGMQLGAITDPCLVQTRTISASSDTCSTCVYFWSTGDAGPTLEVEPGFQDSVHLLIARRDGCLSRDTLFVSNPIPPSIDLGPRDSSIVTGQTITIGGNNPNLQYLWSSGDTTASVVVSYEGVWSVTVTDENGCTASDWMRVYQGDKESVYIPNVFSPNFDGLNDYFTVYGDASLSHVVSMEIFDRWGALLYQRTDFKPNYETDGWDGIHRSKRMLPGSYRYHITVEFIDGIRKSYAGFITIVR